MIKKIGYGLLVLAGFYTALAFTLTFWPAPHFQHPPLAHPGVAAAHVAYQPRAFLMRDGVHLFAREVGDAAQTTVLLIHGVGSDSSQLTDPAQLLHQASGARIVALDLRGHGQSGGQPWSVSHAGQYDEDIDDVLMALRHALSTAAPVDGYLLIAPLLGSAAPTATPGRSGSSAGADTGFAIFLTPRLLGVLLFNLIGVHAFNALPILTPETKGENR